MLIIAYNSWSGNNINVHQLMNGKIKCDIYIIQWDIFSNKKE